MIERRQYIGTLKHVKGGDGTACNNLATTMKEEGDIKLTKELFERAITLGNKIAKVNYDDLLEEEAREGVKK